MAQHWLPWRAAMAAALYGPGGFYRRERAGAHFRTSAHASPLFAEGLLRLARDHDLGLVIDMGAGDGTLLRTMRALDADIGLVGVDVADRPAGLPADIAWMAEPPATVHGLLVANEWLDNVPCGVVAVDDGGTTRVVLVEPTTGRERLGDPVAEPDAEWLARWWPVDAPGARAEVGRSRDAAWADVAHRVTVGLALAVDYGHVADRRPPAGTLTGYRAGRQVEPVPDGTRDLTAHVALDAVAAAGHRSDVRTELLSQGEALTRLGVRGGRPPVGQASADPAGYLAALARAGEAHELTDRGGLGDFGWVLHTRG